MTPFAAFLVDVLFVGHSLIGTTLPGMVERAAAMQDRELRSEVHIINGAPLKWNWEHSHTAQGVDGRVALETGRFDHLVLTEAMPLNNHVEWSDSHGFARAWADLARGANPDAQVWIYETWHSLDSGSGIPVPHDPLGHLPWRKRLDNDWQNWTGIAAAAGPDVRVIPAGQAMGRLADAIEAGTVPGLTHIREVFSDDIHLNDRGLYFVTMVMHAALTGASPEGLPPRLVRLWASRDTAVSAAMAERMQTIAGETVRDLRDARLAAPAPAAAQAQTPAQTPAAAQAQTPAPVPERAVAADTDPASPPDVAAAPQPSWPPIRHPAMGFGLNGISDWSVQFPFLDLIRSARSWTGHLPGQFGGWGHAELAAGGHLDDNGWLRTVPSDVFAVALLVLTDLPEDTPGAAGRYRLTWRGAGELRIEGLVRNVELGDWIAHFDFTPGQGTVALTIVSSDPAGTGDYIRDMVLVRADQAALLDAGEVFNPVWAERLRGARMLRFMDWMATNDSTMTGLQDMPRPDDYTYGWRGVPIEVAVDLANHLQADPWITVPHLADDVVMRAYAETVRDRLDPDLRVHVEFSNEVWNWQFSQAHWAEAQGRARWGAESSWVQYYALRASRMAGIWTEVFGPGAEDRLVRVITTQTGWLGLEQDILTAPLWRAEAGVAYRPPASHFDAYAVTGYFSAGLGSEEKAGLLRGWLAESREAARAAGRAQGLEGQALADFIDRNRFALAITRAATELRDGSLSGRPEGSLQDLLTRQLAHHAQVARDHGLRLVMYEGGTHVVAHGPLVDDDEFTAFFSRLNYSDEMAELYRDLLAGWQDLTSEPFNAFVDVAKPSKWGSWGALRHLYDDNPRWRVLAGHE